MLDCPVKLRNGLTIGDPITAALRFLGAAIGEAALAAALSRA
jgi:hypothetical protein